MSKQCGRAPPGPWAAVAFETDNSAIGEVICERAADTAAAAVIMASHG